MMIKLWTVLGLVALSVGGCHSLQSPPPQPPVPSSASQSPVIASPAPSKAKLLQLKLKLADQKDLKTTQGAFVLAGQVLVDRAPERQQLESRRQQLEVEIAAITAIETAPALAANQKDQTASVQQAKQRLQKAEIAIQKYRDQSPYTEFARKYLPAERQQLAQLELEKTSAQQELATAIAQLQATKTQQQSQLQQRQNSAQQKKQLLKDLEALDQQIKATPDIFAPEDGWVQKVEWLKPEGETLVVVLEIAAQPKANEITGPQPSAMPSDPSILPPEFPSLPLPAPKSTPAATPFQ
ncbi:MAG: hypothetical protein HC934_01410 [Acaryochloridaceae cyanobacterium SU_2_1]|nr:hypothetical protein [Acaryochloridaceae cyanobacterium SU_2_1]